VISIGAQEGDSEVFFRDAREWRVAFRWSGKSAAFAARFNPGDASHPVWAAAVALASQLRATIHGDQGEVYDLQTGEVIGA